MPSFLSPDEILSGLKLFVSFFLNNSFSEFKTMWGKDQRKIQKLTAVELDT